MTNFSIFVDIFANQICKLTITYCILCPGINFLSFVSGTKQKFLVPKML